MLVSIVIAIYNSEKYIKRLLDSIINQTYKNIEVICVNDGSTDGTLDILKEFLKKDNRIKIIDKKNEGVSIARNIGIQNSCGKYIYIVDSDDWLEVTLIEKMVSAIEEKKVDCVICNYYKDYESGIQKIGDLKDLENKKMSNRENISNCIKKVVIGELPAYLWRLMVKKEVALKTKLFDTEIRFYEDTLFYIELFCKCNSIYFLNTPLYHYYYNDNGSSASRANCLRNLNCNVIVNKKIKELLKVNNINIPNINIIIDKTHSKFIVNWALNLFYKKDEYTLTYKELKNLLNRDDIQKIFQNVTFNGFPMFLKIPAKLIKRKLYLCVYFDFKLTWKIVFIRDSLYKLKKLLIKTPHNNT